MQRALAESGEHASVLRRRTPIFGCESDRLGVNRVDFKSQLVTGWPSVPTRQVTCLPRASRMTLEDRCSAFWAIISSPSTIQLQLHRSNPMMRYLLIRLEDADLQCQCDIEPPMPTRQLFFVVNWTVLQGRLSRDSTLVELV